MQIDWWTLAFQAVNVLILIWLLSRFLYRPVTAAIAARQQAADRLLADAEAARAAAAAEAAALKSQRDGLAAEAERKAAEMHAEIDRDRARLIAEAKADAAAVAKQAEAAAAAARARVTAELQEKAAILAGDMAATLLRRLPQAQITDAMFQVLLGSLRALPEEERRRLAADAPLAMVTAAPLDDATRDRYLRALADALPPSASLSLAVDPALIAGFELHGQHMRVRNSWRADLDRMLATLKESGNGRPA
jgi:F-type H+-transporting ATPase subunit b